MCMQYKYIYRGLPSQVGFGRATGPPGFVELSYGLGMLPFMCVCTAVPMSSPQGIKGR